MEDFRRQFLAEAAENLRALAEDWRSAQADSDSVRRDAFRTLHTIKGTAQTFGYGSASRLAHELETLLSAIRNGKTAEAENSNQLFLEGIELLVKLLEEKDFKIPRSFRERVKGFVPQTARAPNGDGGGGAAEDFAPAVPREFFLQLSAQEKNALRHAREADKNIFCFAVGFEITNFADGLINFRAMLSEAGEIIATLPGAKSSGDGKINFQILFASLKDAAETKAIAEAGAAEIIFSSSPLDYTNDAAGVLARIVAHGAETAEKLGKRIEFKTAVAVEIVFSPARLRLVFEIMLHLVRNAVDHAVETSGRVEIRLERKANNLRLIVSDDGRGIDAGKIKTAAIEKKLISADEVLTEQQAIDLIFTPEFSTKSETTEISGRGVGLDVVKYAVENAGGRIKVKSRRGGASTTFEIVLPLEKTAQTGGSIV